MLLNADFDTPVTYTIFFMSPKLFSNTIPEVSLIFGSYHIILFSNISNYRNIQSTVRNLKVKNDGFKIHFMAIEMEGKINQISKRK
jgi:hypothetical protein